MKNDLNTKMIQALEKELEKIIDDIVELHHSLVTENYTQFPILIAHRGETEIGQPFIVREEYGLFYSYNVSTLEEMQEIGVILDTKIEEFKKTYGSNKNNTCILLILPNEAQFVFYPLANHITDNQK